MDGLDKLVGQYSLGPVQKHKNIAIVPIKVHKESAVDYITYMEAANKGLLDMRETGSVNLLKFFKKTAKKILMIKGEGVIGGKQNRIFSVNGLVGSKEIDVPVHCQQQSRWHYDGPVMHGGSQEQFGSAEFVMAASVRSHLYKAGARGGQQSQTWNHIDNIAKRLGSSSASKDYQEIIGKKKNDIEDYVRKFDYIEGQTGVVCIIGKGKEKTYFVDMFDKGKTMSNQYKRLLESYTVDALSAKDFDGDTSDATQKEAGDFLDEVLKQHTEESKSLDLGTDHEMLGKEIEGSALVMDDTVVYLNARKGLEYGPPLAEDDPWRPPAPNPMPGPWRPRPPINIEPWTPIGGGTGPTYRGPADGTIRPL